MKNHNLSHTQDWTTPGSILWNTSNTISWNKEAKYLLSKRFPRLLFKSLYRFYRI